MNAIKSLLSSERGLELSLRPLAVSLLVIVLITVIL